MMTAEGRTQIGTLRLRNKGSGIDLLATQLRIANILNGAHLQLHNLSPSAILCIRRLRDPLPGRLLLHSNSIRPPEAWEKAFAESIGRLARQAACPSRGAVPANAEAVLFADRAELLACLASDWCEGSIFTRWWWQGLFKGKDISRIVLSAFHDVPEYIPGALQHLSEKGKIHQFVQALNVHDVRSLLQRVIQRFGFNELQTAINVVLEDGASIIEKGDDANKPIVPTSLPFVNVMPQEAPWRRWAPEAEKIGMEIEQRCFIGIGLMLQRVPTVVRTSSFAHAVHEWQQMAAVVEKVLHPPLSPLPHPEKGESEAGEPETEGSVGHLLKKGPLPPALTETTIENRHWKQSNAIPPSFTETAACPGDSCSDRIYSSEASPIEQSSDAVPLSEAPIETEFGGIFYLVNLGIYLELYGDFTIPLQPGISLSIWDFIALLSERLLGKKIRTDPVWPLLAHLAGRKEGESPGKDFVPPDCWRFPAAWLLPFPEEGVWQRGLDKDRFGDVPPLEQWLDWLFPYVQARLNRALGLSKADDLPRILCEHRARLFVTATHLDIVLSLSELPIEIRLAGLDRNPGWVPAAGRYISFHFQ